MSTTLTIVPKGGAAKVDGYYMPQRLILSAAKPAEVKKEPTYIGTPMYGILHFGNAKENGVVVVVDENADASEAKLYVDTNHLVDGDTGKILADGNGLRGEALDSTISSKSKTNNR